MFPNAKYTNKEELEDMLDFYFDDLYYNETKFDDHKNHVPLEKTVKGAAIKTSFYKEYEIRSEKRTHNIN